MADPKYVRTMSVKGIAENCQSKEERVYCRIRQILSESIVNLPLHRLSGEKAFLERISTFTSFNWSCKPKQISPPTCAKFGWKVVEKDLMQCTSCKQFLSAQIPPAWKINSYLEAIHRLEESLKTSHFQFCPWQNSPSHDNFLHYKLLQRDIAVGEFERRLASLKDISNCLPELLQNQSNISVMLTFYLKTSSSKTARDQIPEMGITENECKQIFQLAHDLGDDTAHNAVILALTGWQKVKENISLQRITCDCCLRIVELSAYFPTKSIQADPSKLQDGDENAIDKSPKMKRLKKCASRPFHPLEQHQSWCPWLQVVSENVSDSDEECLRPAWKMLLGIMRNYENQSSRATDKYVVPSRESILHLKKIVNEWIFL